MNGKIITFYSYKGGTGRSMLLANVAWILASRGARVLMMDWDLEAPGLHRYFHPFLRDGYLADVPGLIEWLFDYRATVTSLIGDEPGLPDDVLAAISNPCSYAIALDVESYGLKNFGALHLIPAGRQDRRYADRVNRFDFVELYEKLDGKRFFQAMRQRSVSQYDYVLIDSRTGVSDTAGVTTLTLPDKLAVCFTLNSQSIVGASGIARSVLSQRATDRDAWVYPVPTRIDRSEELKLDVAREEARKAFSGFPNHLSADADTMDRYWGQVEVPYESFYAYEEVLATFADQPGSVTSMLAAAERVAGYLTDTDITLAPVEDSIRKDILSQYLRRPAGVLDTAQAAERVFTSLNAATRNRAKNLLLRFVYLGPNGEVSGRPLADASMAELSPAGDLFQKEGVIVEDALQTPRQYRFADTTLPAKWPRMQSWIAEEGPFIRWRLELELRRTAFQRYGNDDLYLTERELDAAMDRLNARPEEVSAALREFIEESVRHVARRNATQRSEQQELEYLREVVRSKPEPSTETPLHSLRVTSSVSRSRNLILCADLRAFGANRGSNASKLFEAIDQGLTPELTHKIATYEDGFRDDDFKPMRFLASAFGFGFGRQVMSLYGSIARLYEPGDRIYLFGSGRGATAVRVLASLVAFIGIVDVRRFPSETELQRAVQIGYALHRRTCYRRFGALLGLRPSNGHDVDEFRHKYSLREPPVIEFVGVWDTIDAVRFPVAEIGDFWQTCIYPFRSWDTNLASVARRARHALAIDEDRRSYRPIVWNEAHETTDDRIVQVWFGGPHGDVGGGQRRHGLSSIPLVWMITHAERSGLRFLPAVRRAYEEARNISDHMSSPRAGLGIYFGFEPRPIAKMCEGKQARVRIHASVLRRIAAGSDGYAPGNLPENIVVDDAESSQLGEELAQLVRDHFTRSGGMFDSYSRLVIVKRVSHIIFIMSVVANLQWFAMLRLRGLELTQASRDFMVYIWVLLVLAAISFWLMSLATARLRRIQQEFWFPLRPRLLESFRAYHRSFKRETDT